MQRSRSIQQTLVVSWSSNGSLVKTTCGSRFKSLFGGQLHASANLSTLAFLPNTCISLNIAFCLFVRLLGAILQFLISNRLICNFFSPVLNGCHHPLYCASSTQLLTNASDQKCEPEQARMFKGLKVEGLKGVKDVRDQKVESAE